jgi:phosphate transport system protein
LIMADKHLSSQFDAELSHISTSVLEMGGVVESQIQQTIYALNHLSIDTCDQVLAIEDKVNRMEVSLDQDVTSTMSRRQPTARDLRLLVGVSRITINLERAADEIVTIAKRLKEVLQDGPLPAASYSELRLTLKMAADLLHSSLDGFARLDVAGSLAVLKGRQALDAEHAGMTRKLLTYMMEDPRTITSALNLLFLARAVERVAAHASNIAEATVYVIKGTDIRHTTEAERERIVQ